MSNINLEDLSLQSEEEEGFVFDIEEGGEEQVDFRWCLVGRFLGIRTIHVNSMKIAMAEAWRPVKGVKIKEATTGLFLFQFSHELDMEGVLQGGPWSFDNQMLLVQRVQVGVQIENIPLHHAEFWVQVHNLPTGLMLEKVGTRLANYIGSFVEYDKNNNNSFWRQYMRLRVRVDVRQPLKKNTRVKNIGGEWCTVNFKYEKLGVFCFVCGVLGHAENKCEVRFAMERDDGNRDWSNELRAEPRRRGSRPTSRWLKEESGGSSGGRRQTATEPSVGGHGVDPTEPSNQSTQPTSITQQVSLVPPSSATRQTVAHTITPAPLQNSGAQLSMPSLSNNCHSTNHNSQPPSINAPGNNIISEQLFANNNLAVTSWQSGLPGSMIVLSWNCRGLSVPSAIPNLKNIAQSHKPDIIFLSETLSRAQKMENIRVMLKYDSCMAIDVEGRSGGLAIMWKDSVKCTVLNYSRNFINLVVEDNEKGNWRLTCYYGYPERSRRRMAWELLKNLRDMSTLPCAVSDCDLTDIHLEGYPFTWIKSRGSDHVIEERLDRALASSEWLDIFPNAKLINLLSSHSDHSPILLQCSPTIKQQYKYEFKFENSWLKEEDIGEVVNEGWDSGEGNEITQRLSHCAEKLQRWGRRKRKRFKEEIMELEAEMERLRIRNDAPSIAKFIEVQQQHAKSLVQEEAFWRQRAKMHWLKDGDLNTKFFHRSATVRAKVKKIAKLRNDDDEVVTGQQSIQEVVRKYFQILFQPNGGTHEPVLSLISPRVSAEDNATLVAPITKEEIRITLFQMHPDKSPGPDGFNPAFFQKFWHLCGDEVFAATKEWLERGYFPSSLNETNICLIPKCDSPSSMKDYRPISLCNVLYKMVSKLLANRLKKFLDKYISEEQSAFIEGRSIIDNALIAIEIIHTLKRRTRGGKGELALKIDISKAYDKVEWSFLKGMLIKMGFSDTWVQWMMLCVSSVNYSALVNFEKVGPIHPGRGLRQGDPLSPYLFILVAEDLTSLIKKAVESGDLHGVKICRGAPSVSHLLFADDCFLFCRSNLDETRKLMEILKTYEEASGQEINLSKSDVFFSRNISRAAQEDLSNMMGVRHVLGTGTYLGLPSMVGRSNKETFAFIKDRIWKRINSWRSRHLSRAGKEIMIKSVLQAIPAYVMSIYLLPDSLINDIEKMINAFWWGGGDNNKGIRWLAWKKMAYPKEKGGLGFRDFHSFNMAMVAKQGLNFINNPNSLVARIFKARYFPRSSLLDSSLGNNPSFTWRSIWKSRQVLLYGCRWSICDGSNIKVMGEPWLRVEDGRWVASPQHQGVYNLSLQQLMIHNSKQWDVEKINELFSVKDAHMILAVPLLHTVENDRLIWTAESDGIYSVRSGYRKILEESNPYHRPREGDAWSALWKVQAPPRVKHLLWRICKECLPTRVRLRNRYVQCPVECPCCLSEPEEDWHMFFGCEGSMNAWYEHKQVAGKIANVLWCIWQNRNNKVWNDTKINAQQVGLQASHMWHEWPAVQGIFCAQQNQEQQLQTDRAVM
ncbi:hypothetical protein TSUD_392810 [Trifolium subterraneum]|uniref:Reverse transcriptase domain-containing protein n=1 Tax=Trifolium subterraneum TaxID=3900 RepID=A0A2Z6N3D8_TRISU|nr:hypothetical protein TSUD_392810 [Trifolium subterraneum]